MSGAGLEVTDSSMIQAWVYVLPSVGLAQDNHRVAVRCWAGGHKGWLFITLILVMHSLNVGPSGDLQNMIKLCPCFSPLISYLILQPAQCVICVTTAGAGVLWTARQQAQHL